MVNNDGMCSYVLKIHHAQYMSASGVTVASTSDCSSDSDGEDCASGCIVSMPDDGSEEGSISIPLFMMLKKDADAI